ncbi:CapA family protein [Vallitalea okinawensis]|uniref:CapA family protein n=1 Tax=Vallitalea okinawensis TaxID=2078660 RepID=UPI000CFCC3E4|nr:CapA family protein [Vallitalea okinawensis]
MKKVILIGLICLCTFFVGCTSSDNYDVDEEKILRQDDKELVAEDGNEMEESEYQLEVEPEVELDIDQELRTGKVPEKTIINLVSVGDVMVHRSQLVKAYQPGTTSFDFSKSFEMIEKYIKSYDYAVANLETTLSGKDQGIRLENSNYYQGYQGYPTFNSPEILATNIADAGFDMVTTANNHCFDSWNGGVINTISEVEKAGMDHIGTFATPEDPRVLIKDINGIQIAFFNYTYSTNGINPHVEDLYMVNTLDNYDPIKIQEMYDEIRTFSQENQQVDLTYVYIHFGNEYHIYPGAIQQNMVEELIRAGADVIVGTHPHVLQPMENVEVELEDGTTKKGLVFYSLGNFLSSQIYTTADPVPKDVGIIINMTIEKDGDEEAVVTKVGLIPTWVQWTDDMIRTIPVDKSLDSYDKGDNDYGLTQKDYNRLIEVQQWTIEHFISNMDADPEIDINQYVIKID